MIATGAAHSVVSQVTGTTAGSSDIPMMTLLGRAMFQTSGTLTGAAPGEFSSVRSVGGGTLVQSPGGAYLSGGVPASADPGSWANGSGYTALGNLAQTVDQPKVVIGCWFLFKQIESNGANSAAIMGLGQVDPVFEVLVSAGTVKIDQAWGAIFGTLPSPPATDEWLYLSLAAKNTGGTTWSVRAFYKHLGESNLTQWASGDGKDAGLSSFPHAMFGIFYNNSRYDGRISACTVHAFKSDDFSDVIYPRDIMEPV